AFLLLFPVLSGAAAAQDARATLQAAVRAMGTDMLRCITYSGTGGYVGLVGQRFSPAADWPEGELAHFCRVINYDAKTMREEQTRRQGNYPARGGGGIPIQGEQRLVSLVSGNSAWDLQGTNVNPQPALGEVRQLEIFLDPHGFLKGAMMAKDLVGFERYESDDRRNILAYTMGKFRIQGSIDPQTNRVVRIQTFVPTPMLGDTSVEKTYGNYKQFGTVWFPTNFHHHDNWDHE